VALDGNAAAIVSGDEHLLKFSSSSVPIVTVAMFMEKYHENP
jgi:predicted nucleic acid-binding protein